ncbi:MAG: EcsC family protein [Anaerolineae bacterium]|nr:EcsC family protein [Anaerolineae bacterium]
MDNDTLLRLILILFVIALLISVVLIGLVVFAFRRFQRFVTPDIGGMQRKLAQLRADNPNASTEALVGKIIHQQSFKSGLVGAITGLGGFVTLPIAIPVDVLVSLRLQATMVQFIAMLYGETQPDSQELKLQTYLVMSGGVKVTETSFQFIMKIVLRILGKSLAKLVPVIGAVVGFIVNYALAQTTGNIAMRWYAGKAQRPALAGRGSNTYQQR